MSQKVTIDNLRDFGGLKTADGREFRFGKLYRTSALHAKTAADKRLVEGLNLDCIIDFRTPAETAEVPDYVPSGVEYVHASVLNSPEHQALAFSKKDKRRLLTASAEDMQKLKDVISDTYRVMPFASEQYNKLFSRMDEGKTIAFHCTAGKDRTGVAALMIELALNRSLDDAKYEYMLSNDYREATNQKTYRLLKFLHAPAHSIDACMYALTNHEDNLELCLNTVYDKYGTFDNFLYEVYRVDDARKELWKKYYLQ